VIELFLEEVFVLPFGMARFSRLGLRRQSCLASLVRDSDALSFTQDGTARA
jgi:hypothetical protein